MSTTETALPPESSADADLVFGGCPTLKPADTGSLPIYTREYLKLVSWCRHWWRDYPSRPGDWFLNLRTGDLQLMLGNRPGDHWSTRHLCYVPGLEELHELFRVYCAGNLDDPEDCPLQVTTTARGEWRVEAQTPHGRVLALAADSQHTALLSALMALESVGSKSPAVDKGEAN